MGEREREVVAVYEGDVVEGVGFVLPGLEGDFEERCGGVALVRVRFVCCLEGERGRTVTTQSNTPSQSPVSHAFLLPSCAAVPSALKLQFVRAHTRPCQSCDTDSSFDDWDASSKPWVDGPLPSWVARAGHMVVGQKLVILMGIPVSLGALCPPASRPVAAARSNRIEERARREAGTEWFFCDDDAGGLWALIRPIYASRRS